MVNDYKIIQSNCMVLLSLPAWGAWIEMKSIIDYGGGNRVAPRMGSVDRNKMWLAMVGRERIGRSPHGERG